MTYPQERETVGGKKAKIFSEVNGFLIGWINEADSSGSPPRTWYSNTGKATWTAFNSHDLKPLTPPEHGRFEGNVAVNTYTGPFMKDPRDDKIDGLESELYDAVRVCWDRGAKDYVRSNYPEWAKEWDAPPKPEMVEVDGRVYVHSPANLGQFSYHNGARAAARLHITGPVPKRASDADLPTYEARIMPEGWRETITHHLHCLDRSNPLAAFLRAILGESE